MSSNTSTQQRASQLAMGGTPNQQTSRMDTIHTIVTIIGRGLVATLFIFAGGAKIANPTPFLEHMTQFGVPTVLLPPVIALELGAGLAILVGWRIREAAGALAVFCILAAAIFHYQLWIKPERTLFFKDLAIAGGLFLMAANAARRGRSSSKGSEAA
jgi:putative oxidoreductase